MVRVDGNGKYFKLCECEDFFDDGPNAVLRRKIRIRCNVLKLSN